MRRTVILLPDLVGSEDASVLRQTLPTLSAMAESSGVFGLTPMPRTETPESLWLGFPPDVVRLRQGPLTVSALGADPPERSTHFHLSLLSLDDEGVVHDLGSTITSEEEEALRPHLARLNTKTLTLLAGDGSDHGLVWEGLGDLGTTSAAEAVGKPMRGYRPEGDAENLLRRLIDDSVNLLEELDLNIRRRDEGHLPLNLLWPWGEGVRRPVPNLALRRGERAEVWSASMRLAGLARLAGYRHGDRRSVGRGTSTGLSFLAQAALAETPTIVVLEAFREFRASGQMEEAEWFTREVDDRLLRPLFEAAVRDPGRLTVLATGPAGGLGVQFQHRDAGAFTLPFDERSREEKTLRRCDLHEAVASALVSED